MITELSTRILSLGMLSTVRVVDTPRLLIMNFDVALFAKNKVSELRQTFCD
jgi:hypothetical protein